MEINIIKDDRYGKNNGFTEDKNLGKLEFELLNEDVSIVNSLRRTMMTDIKSLVFRGFPHESNNIIIEKNNTKFNNEYLKHRISCIPILYNEPKNFKTFVDNYYYKLYVKNQKSEKILITTKDMILYKRKKDGDDEKVKSNYLPKYNNDGIPICYLFPKISDTDVEEELNITMTVYIGRQKEDACWNMVSKCLYYNIEDPIMIEKKKKEFKGDEMALKDFEILDAQRFFKPNQFHVIVETIGVYTNIQIVKYACESIIDKLDKLNEELDKTTEEFNSPQSLILNNDKLLYIFKENTSDDSILYTLRLENEDYTIGKLIEKHMDLSTYKYISFKKEHPHDSYSFIHFVYTIHENKTDQLVIKDLKKTISLLIEKYTNIYKVFNS